MGAGIAPFPAKMFAAVGAAQHRKVEGCGGKSQQDHRAAEEEVIGQGEQHGAHQHGDDQAIEQAAGGGKGHFLGPKTFQICLIINGIVGPLLLGGAVATFFNGSNFLIDKGNITNSLQPVISRWANASHGLDALLDPWTVVLGLAVLMLARILGMLYIKNNIEHQQIQERCTRQLPSQCQTL